MSSRARVFFYMTMILLLALISAFSVIPARADDGAPAAPSAPAAPAAPASAPASGNTAPAAPSSNVASAAPASNTDSAASAAPASAPAAPSSDTAPAAPAAPASPASAPSDDSSATSASGGASTGASPAAPAAPTDAPQSGVAPTNVDPPSTAAPTDASPAAQASNPAPTDTVQSGVVPTIVAPTNAAPAASASDVAPTTVAPINAVPTDVTPTTDTPAALSQVPAGTDVVVLNEAGASVPLASQAASDIIATGDPMWCPTGVTPGGAGCSSSYTSLQNLVADVGVGLNPAANGVIWIQNTTFAPAGGILFDGSASSVWTTWSNYSLTLQGGWSGSGTAITTDTPSIIQDSLRITHWNADVTLSDIKITGLTSGGALQVFTTRKITLTRVKVKDNTGAAGALLNNAGVGPGTLYNGVFTGTGDLSITSSEFSTNTSGSGLEAYSNGLITLSDIIANFNGEEGVLLNNHTASTPKNVIVSGTNTFNSNAYDGLFVNSNGAITVSNITANGNDTDSIDFDGFGLGAIFVNNYAGSTAGITLTGINIFNGNYFNGLVISSFGAISANNLTADLNSGIGANLDNCSYNEVTSRCDAVTPQPVTLTGSSTFNDNGGDALMIGSLGNISTSNLTVNHNKGRGAEIGNDVQNANGVSSIGTIVLNGNNTFNNNYYDGLNAYSNGSITTNNLTADNNGTWSVSDNDPNKRGGSGVILGNDTSAFPAPVTLNGTNEFNGNYAAWWTSTSGVYDPRGGLLVGSNGAITANNVTANNNVAGPGANLDTCNGTGYGGCATHTNPTISLTGLNTFNNNNANDGLDIYATGAIVLNNVTSGGNGGYGAFLNNHQPASTGGVTLAGANNMSGNNGSGLFVISNGAITVSGLTANDNGQNGIHGYGVELNNQFTGVVQPVTINGGTFINNFSGPWFVLSNGTVKFNSAPSWCPVGVTPGGAGCSSFTNLQALVAAVGSSFYPAANGVIWIQNSTFNTAGTIFFNANASPVWTTWSNYSLTLQGGWSGPGTTTTPGTPTTLQDSLSILYWHADVTLSDITIQGITSGGALQVITTKKITLTRVTVENNIGTGGALLNNSGQGPGPVGMSPGTGDVLITSSEFSHDDGNGLELYSNGQITLSDIIANFNGEEGAYVNNRTSASAKNVTISGTNTFNNNGGDGLLVSSKGVITASNITAIGNGSDLLIHFPDVGLGALFMNNYTGATAGITLTGTNTFNYNYSDGLGVDSNGIITLNNITANGNGLADMNPVTGPEIDGYGASVENTSNPSAPQDVIINGTNAFNNNWLRGLSVHSYGAITLNNVTAGGNGQGGFAGWGYGVFLDNCNANSGSSQCKTVTPKPIIITGTNAFTHNYDQGLEAASKGAITLNNVNSDYNGKGGTFLVNDFSNAVGGISVNNTVGFLPSFNNNAGGDGLEVYSRGSITLNSITANGNGHYGATLDNSDAGTPQPVTLTGTNVFNTNFGDGLDALSRGMVTLNSLTANGNGTGHDDPNTGPESDGIGVFVDNRYNPSAPQDVIINGTNTFTGNWLRGLEVQSFGAITLNNVTASGNGMGGYADWGYGVFLNNCQPNAGACQTITPKPVNITGTNVISGTNIDDGLLVLSKGAINLNNVSANGNGGDGAFLENDYSGAVDGVTLTGANQFNTNWMNGLEIYTNGAISLNNTTATDNGQAYANSSYGYGVYLDNCNFNVTICANLTPKAVTLTGTNNLSHNYITGLYVASKGAITVNGLTANNNGQIGVRGYGAQLTNQFTGVVQTVTVNGGAFNGNGLIGTVIGVPVIGVPVNGLDIKSNGVVTINGLPMWCPSGVAPGGAGCSSFANLQALVAAVTGGTFHPAANGVIWIQNSSFDPAGTIFFNGNASPAWTTWSNYSLTLQGGWSGPGTTITTGTPTTIQDSLQIFYWHADVTLSDITITGLTSGGALQVITTKKITLTRVTVKDNIGTGGALLNNSGQGPGPVGMSPGTGDVSITSSAFTNNDGSGLELYSNGQITLSDVIATNNGEEGVLLNNRTASSPKTVTISGTNTFTNNGYDGLFVTSKGAITANNITANGNATDLIIHSPDVGLGALFMNNFTGATAGITLTGTNTFNYNVGIGLDVESFGSITVGNITAIGNGTPTIASFGTHLMNNFTSVTAGITLTGLNTFNNNSSDGLRVESNGAITLNNITANGNGLAHLDPNTDPDTDGFGASVENTSNPAAPQDVIINGANAFNNNWLMGLNVHSYGAITLNNVTATVNGQGHYDTWGYGVFLGNCEYDFGTSQCKTVTPKPINITGTNTFTSNNNDGLVVSSKGAITLNNANSNNNGWDGAYLANDFPNAVGGISVSNTVGFSPSFNNNTGGYGLEVYSHGAITLNSITANGNGQSGAALDNSGAGIPQPVTLTGASQFNTNHLDGLNVLSRGSITLNDIDAIGNNDNDGVYLDNTSGTLGVTLTGVNVFSGNGFRGLEVYTNGAISASNLVADSNGGRGAWFDNCQSYNDPNPDDEYCITTTVMPVTLTGTSEFKFNAGGINIHTNGAVTVNNITASNNSSDAGIWITNDLSSVSAIVMMTGTNIFNDNFLSGIYVSSKGVITLNNVTANGNGGNTYGYGAELRNGTAASPKAVNLNVSGSNPDNIFDNNRSGGLLVESLGIITVSSLEASDNLGAGALLDNTHSGPPSPQNVTVNGFGHFNNNGDSGMVILSYGLITVNNLDAEYNGQNNFYNQAHYLPIDPAAGWGAYLDNCGFDPGLMVCTGTGAPKAIALNGANTFNGNFQDGLWATSLGPISATQLHANTNSADGIYLDNQWLGGTGGISVTSATPTDLNVFNNNSWYGLELSSNGAITLNNILANGNGSAGAWVDTADHLNPYAAGTQTVALTGRNRFVNNGHDGLIVLADGIITINNLTASGNHGDHGAFLDNCNDTGAGCTDHGTITLTGISTFNDNNNGDGLYISSHGNVILNSVTADNNSGRGVYVKTDGTLLVSCGSMINNGSYGWEFGSPLTVTLKNVFAYNNHGSLPNHNTLLDGGTLITSRSCP